MKKKIAAMLTAAMVLTLGSVSAFAAPSPVSTADGAVVVSVQDGFTWGTITDEKIEKDNGAALTAAAAVRPANAEGAGEVVFSQDISPTTAKQNADGSYDVELTIENREANTEYVVLLWNGTGWDPVTSSFVNGKLNAHFPHLTPVKIVAYKVAAPVDTDAIYNNGYWQGVADGKAQAAAAAAAGNMVASPKTGETASLLPVIALLGAAGVVFCTRKSVMSR